MTHTHNNINTSKIYGTSDLAEYQKQSLSSITLLPGSEMSSLIPWCCSDSKLRFTMRIRTGSWTSESYLPAIFHVGLYRWHLRNIHVLWRLSGIDLSKSSDLPDFQNVVFSIQIMIKNNISPQSPCPTGTVAPGCRKMGYVKPRLYILFYLLNFKTSFLRLSTFSRRDAWVYSYLNCPVKFERAQSGSFITQRIVASIYMETWQWRSNDIHQVERDNVIKWKHFWRYWPFVRGIHRSSVNSPRNGQ